MTVKIVLLKTGQYLISEIEERPEEDADCILINPKVVIDLFQILFWKILFHIHIKNRFPLGLLILLLSLNLWIVC